MLTHVASKPRATEALPEIHFRLFPDNGCWMTFALASFLKFSKMHSFAICQIIMKSLVNCNMLVHCKQKVLLYMHCY